MPSRCLTLDDQAARHASLVGAKAAGLADALAAGLPVLPGVVIPVVEATPVVTAVCAALRAGNERQARLAAMQVEPDLELIAELEADLADFPRPLIVRSSSPLEADGVFAGAFSTFHGVDTPDLATAVRGCWGSAFSVGVLERAGATGARPEDLGLAVLVQPEITPQIGGTARLRADATVEITATRGPLRPLMEGQVEGDTVQVSAGDGDVRGSGIDATIAREVAALTRRTADLLDHRLVEWAADGRIHLLQSRHVPQAPAVVRASVGPAALASRPALRIAELTQRFPGRLADEMLLPWAVASEPSELDATTPGGGDPLAELAAADELADQLTAHAWGLAAEEARSAADEMFRRLRGDAPEPALKVIAGLSAPPLDLARDLLTRLATIRRHLVSTGVLGSESAFWRLSRRELAETLRGSTPAVASRFGVDRWEPFVHGVVMTAGERHPGVAAAAGAGVGRALVADVGPARPAPHGRYVVVAGQPVPRLSALLFNAAGLVTRAGSPAAHLIESAESLGIPAVVGCELPAEALHETPDLLVAVDGNRGEVAILPTTLSHTSASGGVHEPTSAAV